jgi:Ca-activated chloride channel family protein
MKTVHFFLGVLVLSSLAGCSKCGDEGGGVAPKGAEGKPPLTLVVAYGSEKKSWLEEQARAFEASEAKLGSGRRIRVEGKALGSGEAAQAIAAGDLKPHVFSPASGAYITLLNDTWLSAAGRTKAICPSGEPLVLSPIVIALWKPMAEALGWPKKALGWSDFLRIAADPKGWGAYGHPEWGGFKLGHTHPEYSNSGLLAVLAEAYAGAKKTRGLTVADLEKDSTTKLLTSIEGMLVHYGKSTGFYADKMLSRGPGFVSAAVLYENLVIESYAKQTQAPFPIVAVYPVEGTFWSDHPYSVLDAPWVGAEEREAAQVFLAFLKAKPAQERALALGFRPGDPAIAIAAPIDEAHGVDPKQPQTLLEVPEAATLKKLLEVWRKTKKATDVVLVFDKSGSMNGAPLAQAKVGAKAFLGSLTDRDRVTLMFFDNKVYPPVGPLSMADGRGKLTAQVDSAIAAGGTSMYDAVAQANQLARERALTEPGTIHAVVVMTDGKDENSQLNLEALRGQFSGDEAAVRLFTIAYGDQAEGAVLESIAEAGKGSYAKGSLTNIVDVYRDMASFF